MAKPERRKRMGLVTNRMSDAVYEHLMQQIEDNRLSAYLIECVEQDMENTFLKERVTLQEAYIKKLERTLTTLNDKVDTLVRRVEREDTLARHSKSTDETLVNLNIVSDEQVSHNGFDEAVDLDF